MKTQIKRNKITTEKLNIDDVEIKGISDDATEGSMNVDKLITERAAKQFSLTHGGTGLPSDGEPGDILTLNDEGEAVWTAPAPPLTPEVQVAIAYSNLTGLNADQKQAAIDLANAQLLHGYRSKIVGMWIFKAGTTLAEKSYNFVDPSNYGKVSPEADPVNGNVAPVAVLGGIQIGNNNSTLIVMPYFPGDIIGGSNIGIGLIQPVAKDIQFYNGYSSGGISCLIDGNDVYCAIGSNTTGAIVGGGATKRTSPFWQRKDDNTVEFYHAGAKQNTITKLVDVMENNKPFLFARNNGSTVVISAMYLVQALTESEADYLFNDLTTFLSAL